MKGQSRGSDLFYAPEDASAGRWDNGQQRDRAGNFVICINIPAYVIPKRISSPGLSNLRGSRCQSRTDYEAPDE